MGTCVCLCVCVCQIIQLMHSSWMESGLWRRPCCLDYWVCQDCEGNKRRKRESEQGWLSEEHLVLCHTYKSKAPLQKLCWIPKAISSCGSSRNHFITQGQQLFDTCTGVHPHRGPPVLGPEDISWKLLYDRCPPTSVGLPLVQKASPWEAWLHRGSEVDKGAGSLLLLCMCVYVCVVKPLQRSPHESKIKDPAGYAAFCTSASPFIIVNILSWPRKKTSILRKAQLV